MMRVTFNTTKEPNGTYTVTIVFRDCPSESQADAAADLVKRALLAVGAIGSTTELPIGDKS